MTGSHSDAHCRLAPFKETFKVEDGHFIWPAAILSVLSLSGSYFNVT